MKALCAGTLQHVCTSCPPVPDEFSGQQAEMSLGKLFPLSLEFSMRSTRFPEATRGQRELCQHHPRNLFLLSWPSLFYRLEQPSMNNKGKLEALPSMGGHVLWVVHWSCPECGKSVTMRFCNPHSRLPESTLCGSKSSFSS